MSDAHVVLQLLVSISICIYWIVAFFTVLEAEPLGFQCVTMTSCMGW